MPVPGDDTTPPPIAAPEAVLRAFLLSDIRGFSSFSALRGAEASSALTRRFGAIATDVLLSSGGEIVDMTGDEVLAAFASPRQAIAAAIEFQSRLLAATREDPTLPLPAGVGMDFGEAVVTNGRWSANAINISARLCSLASGGEILATAELAHVAQAMAGVTYEPRNSVVVKGIAQPVRRVRVLPADTDAVAALAELGLSRAAPLPVEPKKLRKRLVPAVAAAVILAVVATLTVIHLVGGGDSSIAIRSNAIGQIDGNGRVRREVDVGNDPGAIAADNTAVWVVNNATDTVTRVDARHRSAPANTVKVGAAPTAVAVGAGATWVANSADRTVSRINPGPSPAVGDTIEVGNGPAAIAVGYGLIWVANLIDDSISVIDPTSKDGKPADQVVATIPVGAQPTAITVGFGSVWVSNAGSSNVSRIDPATKSVTTSIGVGNGPRAVTVGSDGVWVANTFDDTVTRIDPRLGTVTDVIPVGAEPSGITVAAQQVWVSNSNSDSLSAIDEHARKVTRLVRVNGAPQAVAAVGNNFWVSARVSSAVHVGGTLKIADNDNATSFDPAFGYTTFAEGITSITNDGLVTYERAAGPAGATVVPDLARRLPTVSDGGRTYSFQLRSGIRYSTGAKVKASDFRTSIERAVRISQVADGFYSGIVGVAKCTAHPEDCDLTQGVATDDSSGIVVVHLTKADPDLLYKLALPFGDVVPAETPIKDTGFGPHAGTGPYVLSSGSRSGAVLTRNKYFKQWSPIAQPAGYPDRIEVSITHDDDTAAAHRNAVASASGKIDWSASELSSDDATEFVRTRTAQLHPYDQNVVRYYFMNTTVAPFTDVRVRQAVNYAVDRHAIAEAMGGSLLEVPTCQVMTPSLGGYQPYCPYTKNPGANKWSGPDLPRARGLIRAAGAVGAPVSITTAVYDEDQARLLAKSMRAIGLEATVKVIPQHDDAYYAYVGNPAKRVAVAREGWAVDYPEPSASLGALLRCSSRGLVYNVDESQFCNPSIDRRMDAAGALQNSDPASARSAWAALDRSIVDQAPWIPLTTRRQFDLLSSRIGNYQHHPVFGFLFDQAWVR